jgi:hypothetical protein
MIFVVMGLSFVAAVAVGERLAPVAGDAFTGGFVDGGNWQETEFPPIPMN